MDTDKMDSINILGINLIGQKTIRRKEQKGDNMKVTVIWQT